MFGENSRVSFYYFFSWMLQFNACEDYCFVALNELKTSIKENVTSVSLIFLARCKTKPYQKSNGKNFCGYAVKVALNWQQAFDYCKISGGRLPEVYNLKDNVNILQQKVNTGPCFIKKFPLN